MVTKIAAGEFKAKCLALLDRVYENRETLIVTKRGKPVARVVPLESKKKLTSLRGSIVREGDLISPIGGDWEAER